MIADGPVACDEYHDEHGRLIGVAGWEWDPETGAILDSPHAAAERAIRRWGSRPANG